MKIILTQDVAKIGRKNSVVEVPDGYARNQLIPKGQAKPATPENLKAIVHLNKEASAANAAAEEKFFAVKTKLKDQIVKLAGLKNDNGHLFAAVKPEQVRTALTTGNIEVDPKWIKLPTQIKTTGEHTAELHHEGHKIKFTLLVD